MAGIANATMFTNGTASSGTPDLLQRAFQQVVEDEDHENDFVAFLQSDESGSQTIHLTPAQAAALGLTFEMDSGEDVAEEISYQREHNGIIANLEESFDISEVGNTRVDGSSPDAIQIERIAFQSDRAKEDTISDDIRVERTDLREWTVHESGETEELEDGSIVTNISMQEVDLSSIEQPSQGDTTQIETDPSQESGDATRLVSLNRTNEPRVTNVAESSVRYAFERNEIQARQISTVQNSQAQILQRLPMILPSSQFIIKPTQAIPKPVKNVRILPNTGKISSTGQSSIFLPKTALLNTMSPQIIKATPITTQLLNGNSISAQLLNPSQVLTGSCELANRVVSVSHVSGSVANATSISSPNLLNNQVRLSPISKTSQIRKQNNFPTPILKRTSPTSTIKSAQILNNSGVKTTPISTPFLKSLQIPAQMLGTASPLVVKNTVASNLIKNMAHPGSPVVFRGTTPAVKSRDVKTATASSASSVLRSTQVVSTPISILKPQSKVTFNNGRQNLLVNSQNAGNLANNVQNVSVVSQATVCNQQNEFDPAKLAQSGAVKQKPNVSANGTAVRIGKKAKIATLQKPAPVASEKNDSSKPLGSSENPIQIVQQGHTFHSMQRLTQSQLKQIAHVLQQRSQEATMSNERIVYRVVFPEELDLRIRSPGNLVKGRGGKRGRPKKNAARPPIIASKLPIPEEEQEELKDERKKVVARTRSGRLSRPPRHMVRDYKHLHHSDFMQPDLDDSDGGYSDFNTNSEKLEDDESRKELLTGLEVPKRKISDHFRCPTCNKIYLGRTRMARHFEMHPDHGSPEQLPPPTPEPELKSTPTQDPLKRKGKKRGPWAYVTPEAKSERRQVKLREAISVCENFEIIKIAAKPVLGAQSLFELLVLKSDGDVKSFLGELKEFVDKVRERAGAMLSAVGEDERGGEDVIDVRENQLCDALGLKPGVYRMNGAALGKGEDAAGASANEEGPPSKLRRLNGDSEEGKENLDERISSGFSSSSDLSVSDFLGERKIDPAANAGCPEVLTALTLMPRNPSPLSVSEVEKTDNVSKLLISSPEIQSQLAENPGFQKVDIGTTKISGFRKLDTRDDSVNATGCATGQMFDKLSGGNYEQPKLEPLDQAFVKLEPTTQSFVKLENGSANAYAKQDVSNYEKIQNGGYESAENASSHSFAKGFQKLVNRVVPMTTADLISMKAEATGLDGSTQKILPTTAMCKISDGLPILQDTVPVISTSTCDSGIFGGTEHLDISKIGNYDHISHLDILSSSGAIDKNLMIDEKLVEQLHLVDQSTLVDELVSERLKNIMPDNILESNLIANNLDADLDFEALSEEFNRNTRS